MVQKAIGALLKERRTKLDWSLDRAEKQTSIKKIYISALETDNYAVFPGPFYVRAYLKQYVAKLDLDVEAILEAFDKGVPVEVEGPFEDTGNYRFIRPDARGQAENDAAEETQTWLQHYLPMILLSSFALIILIVVGVVVFLNYPKDPDISPASYSLSQSSSSSTPESSSSSTSSESAPSSSSSATTVNVSTDGKTVQVKSGEDPLQLVLSLKGSASAATASVTGTVTQTASLSNSQPTATITLEKGAATTTLTVSDLNSLNIEVNGQSLNLPVPTAEPAAITLEITYIQ